VLSEIHISAAIIICALNITIQSFADELVCFLHTESCMLFYSTYVILTDEMYYRAAETIF
jgi:hypothetical protein